MTNFELAARKHNTGTLNMYNVYKIAVERDTDIYGDTVHHTYFFTKRGVFTVTTFGPDTVAELSDAR